MFTSIFPGSSLLRETDLQIFGRLPALKQLLFKWREGSELIYSRLLIITGSFLAPFFWIALITPFTDRRWSRIRFFLFGCLFMGICRYIICSRQIEDINIIIPLAIMAGTAAFVAIREKSGNLLKHIILMVFLGLNLFPFFDQLQITPISYPPTKNNLIRIKRQVGEEGAIISDLPWAVAWYAERKSVWLPSDPDGVPALLERFPEIKYIYLTPETNRYISSGSRISWAEIYRNPNRSKLWKAEEVISFPQRQLFSHITRENPRNP